MRREDLRWTVPGAISGANTSRSDYHVDWRANAEQTEIWTTHAIIREGNPPSASCELVANVPPWPSEGPFTVALLQKSLASRYEAHPLANQLPGALLLVANVLESGANPLEVVRISARYACPGGVCRAFGYLLMQDPLPCDLVTLRRYATACLLLRFSTVSAHSDGNVIAESYEREIVGSDFPLPEGFTFSGLNSEIGPTRSPESVFDERLCSALRAAKTLVPQALERLGTKAALPPALPGPDPALTAEQAIEKVTASFDGGFLSRLGWEVKSLAYQPLEVVAPLLGPMLREQELPTKVLGAVGTARDALAAHPENFLLPLATIGLPQPPPPVKPPPPEPIAYVSERRARRPSRRSTQREKAAPLPEVEPPPPRSHSASPSPSPTRLELFLGFLAIVFFVWLVFQVKR